MVLCFPYFMDNFIALVILLPLTIIIAALWDFLDIWIGSLFSFVDVYIEVWLISKEGMNRMKIIEELEIVLEIHLLMSKTLPTYTWKIHYTNHKDVFKFTLKHSLHLMESHNIILFNYITNYAIFYFSLFFFNFVMQLDLLVSP
jgi:hypothetical protein